MEHAFRGKSEIEFIFRGEMNGEKTNLFFILISVIRIDGCLFITGVPLPPLPLGISW